MPSKHIYHVLEVVIRAKEAGQDGCAHLIESTFPAFRLGVPDQPQARYSEHDRTHKRE